MEFLKTLKVIQRVASREFEEKDQTEIGRAHV